MARVVNNESCIRTFVQYSFNMGNELPSAESARADNDHLLAKVIDEFLPPTPEMAPEQPLVEVVPPKPKNKPKKKKNRNKSTHKEEAVPQDTLEPSPATKHQDIQAPNNSAEDEITPPLPTEPSPEMIHSEIAAQEEQQFTEADLTPPPISEQTVPIETSEEDSSNIEQPPLKMFLLKNLSLHLSNKKKTLQKKMKMKKKVNTPFLKMSLKKKLQMNLQKINLKKIFQLPLLKMNQKKKNQIAHRLMINH